MTRALRLAELSWPEVRALDPARTVALLPVGATEAHGPHLPLDTDVIIATAMVEDSARRLAARGYTPILLPPLAYAPAPFAAAFPGTVSLSPATFEALLVELAAGVARAGIRVLGIGNAHLDPTHIAAIHAACGSIGAAVPGLRVASPDLTRRPWALRLGEEFRSGACHAGRYETSIVLAARPKRVRDRALLVANPASLSRAIREGKQSFEEAGGPLAYFGDPAAATAKEGRALIRTLGAILLEALELPPLAAP